MNEEDLSDIMKKITSMMNSNNSDSSTDSTSTNQNTYSDNASDDSSSNGFNIDFDTLLKVKSIMDKMNSNQNDARSNLLLSLKPYLKPSRKDKVDQYIKLLNMSNIIELFNNDTGGGSK